MKENDEFVQVGKNIFPFGSAEPNSAVENDSYLLFLDPALR